MDVRIVKEFPPVYAQVAAAFDLRGYQPIFAYGDAIYNPHGVDVPPALVAHECVHMERQGSAPDVWWQRYIDDPSFRLNEELVAHVAEYEHIINSDRSTRNQRRVALKITAQRLAAKIYGSLISVRDAKTAIANLAT